MCRHPLSVVHAAGFESPIAPPPESTWSVAHRRFAGRRLPSSRRLVEPDLGPSWVPIMTNKAAPDTVRGTGRFFYGGWRQPPQTSGPKGLLTTAPCFTGLRVRVESRKASSNPLSTRSGWMRRLMPRSSGALGPALRGGDCTKRAAAGWSLDQRGILSHAIDKTAVSNRERLQGGSLPAGFFVLVVGVIFGGSMVSLTPSFMLPTSWGIGVEVSLAVAVYASGKATW